MYLCALLRRHQKQQPTNKSRPVPAVRHLPAQQFRSSSVKFLGLSAMSKAQRVGCPPSVPARFVLRSNLFSYKSHGIFVHVSSYRLLNSTTSDMRFHHACLSTTTAIMLKDATLKVLLPLSKSVCEGDWSGVRYSFHCLKYRGKPSRLFSSLAATRRAVAVVLLSGCRRQKSEVLRNVGASTARAVRASRLPTP